MADGRAPQLRIRAAGYLGEADRQYLVTIRRRVAGWSAPSDSNTSAN